MLDNKAYKKMDYALCLLSAAANGKKSGCIINSFHQVTSSYPARFTVAVSKDNQTYKEVEAAGSFCVTLLASDASGDIVNNFGYKSGRVTDKFAGFDVKTDEAGNPYITDGMISRVSCKIVDKVDIGNFVLYVGQATEAEVITDGEVLTLAAYTNRGKATPPAATVYREMVGGGFKCSVCGYVYESETIRDDFQCPICRATADKFVRQE